MTEIPAVELQGIPWILSVSITPVGINPDNVPPCFSGYPTEGDRSLWKKFDKRAKDLAHGFFEDARDWIIANGGPEIQWRRPYLLNYSPYANIYMYPLELDYTSFRPNPPNFHRFDTFARCPKETFNPPKELENLPGKLVYFSMGTIGCSDLNLMQKLLGILSKSPHRFIVSKGPLDEKIPLASNMWGARSLPQTKVLPLVDLVITHGGNNTITESFYCGKRVLILPLLGDQFDNGQRVFETGLGLQFRPYQVTEKELLAGIEKLLNDDLLERRMRTIGQRMQASNSQASAAELIENVTRNNARKMLV